MFKDLKVQEVVFFALAVATLGGFTIDQIRRGRKMVQRCNELEQQHTTVVTKVCRHVANLRDWLELYGERFMYTLPHDEREEPNYCHKCLMEGALKCSKCNSLILPGEHLSIYRYKDSMGEVEKILIDGHLHVPRCRQFDCAKSTQEAFYGYLQVNQICKLNGKLVAFTRVKPE